MYTAFKSGRMDKSPAEFWYKGELGFFDNYIVSDNEEAGVRNMAIVTDFFAPSLLGILDSSCQET
jgi:hypothetical protein